MVDVCKVSQCLLKANLVLFILPFGFTHEPPWQSLYGLALRFLFTAFNSQYYKPEADKVASFELF